MYSLSSLLPLVLHLALPLGAPATLLDPGEGGGVGAGNSTAKARPQPPVLPPPTWGSVPAAEPSAPLAAPVEAPAEPNAAADGLAAAKAAPASKAKSARSASGSAGSNGAAGSADSVGSAGSVGSADRPDTVVTAAPANRKPSVAAKTSKPEGGRPRGPKPSPLCDFRTPVHEHVVAEGENLGLIAGRYGLFRRDLVRTNPELTNADLIHPGQIVKVCPELPPRERIELTHVVAAGETLLGIANSHDLSLDEMLELQPTPITDPNTIRVGQSLRIVKDGEILVGFRPDAQESGRLAASVPLRPSDHYVIKRPALAFGTERTVKLLENTLDGYRARAGGGPKIHVGDLSRRSGGPLAGHKSHQRGIDVDVGLVLKGAQANETLFVSANRHNLDVARTWMLVDEFLRTGEVRYIFLDYSVQKLLYEYASEHGVAEDKLDEYFQYPRGRGRNHGIIRHWRGHKNHLHVRFRR